MSQPHRASAVREVAYPVEHVWSAMATLLPYCSVCDVSVIVDSPGRLEAGTKFRAFSGRAAQTDGMLAAEGGMPGEIVDWSPQHSVATRLEAGRETVVVRVEMAAASPDTTLVTISVEVTPHLGSRLAAAMSRSSHARMARRTVEGEIAKLPAHLALLEEPQG
ncbi:MAG: SRPBCC family protein [Actinomycetota bacterium]|nr:SRPBCC family protein [Actinomycetota bacterium]